MGIYVQENRFQFPMEFSGPWAVNQKVELTIVEQQSLISIFIPRMIAAANNPSVIQSLKPLPSNLLPIKTDIISPDGEREAAFGINNGVLVALMTYLEISSGIIRIGLSPNLAVFAGAGSTGNDPIHLKFIRQTPHPQFTS